MAICAIELYTFAVDQQYEPAASGGRSGSGSNSRVSADGRLHSPTGLVMLIKVCMHNNETYIGYSAAIPAAATLPPVPGAFLPLVTSTPLPAGPSTPRTPDGVIRFNGNEIIHIQAFSYWTKRFLFFADPPETPSVLEVPPPPRSSNTSRYSAAIPAAATLMFENGKVYCKIHDITCHKIIFVYIFIIDAHYYCTFHIYRKQTLCHPQYQQRNQQLQQHSQQLRQQQMLEMVSSTISF